MKTYSVMTREFGTVSLQADRVAIDEDKVLRFYGEGELTASFAQWIGFTRAAK